MRSPSRSRSPPTPSKSAKSIRAIIEQRLERGASTRLELNAASLATARAEQERDAVVIGRQTVLRQLAALAGMPGGTTLDLARSPTPGGPGPSPESSLPDEKRLETQALTLRPLFRADVARSEQANELVRAEKAKRYPWFSLSSFSRLRFSDSQTRPYDILLSIDLTLPIFNGNGGKIAAAEAERRKLEEVRAGHVITVRRDIDIARNEAVRRSELLARYHATIEPMLDEHATLLREAMQGKQLDFLALLSAEDIVVRTQREYVEAQLSYRKARIQLLRATPHGHRHPSPLRLPPRTAAPACPGPPLDLSPPPGAPARPPPGVAGVALNP